MKSAFIISAASSGSGKTLITLGLLEALRRRGLVVQPFKAGPDYIDPGHHSALLGVPSYNLDTWMMGVEGVKRTFSRHAREVSVIEGVMGLYDGRDGVSEEGSTAHLSKVLGLPVVLVVDAQKMARSAGAVVKGFEAYDRDVRLSWVIFNRVGSPRHLEILKTSIPQGSKVKVLGCIPRDEGLAMPSRHLGLVGPKDFKKGSWLKVIDRAASVIEKNLCIDDLIEESALKLKAQVTDGGANAHEIRIAVALDNAFSFYYQENLEILKEHGAEMIFFSPLKDKRLPPGIGGVYLGGGYPELYAKRLEANSSLRGEIKKLAREGLPIFAECGGLMYLGDSIEARGKRFAMAGVFPFASRMLPKRKALGYRELEVSGGPFKCEGRLRGHEFHYSELIEPKAVSKCFKVNGGGREGYFFRNTLATYIHLHFASNQRFAARFVDACKKYGRKGKR